MFLIFLAFSTTTWLAQYGSCSLINICQVISLKKSWKFMTPERSKWSYDQIIRDSRLNMFEKKSEINETHAIVAGRLFCTWSGQTTSSDPPSSDEKWRSTFVGWETNSDYHTNLQLCYIHQVLKILFSCLLSIWCGWLAAPPPPISNYCRIIQVIITFNDMTALALCLNKHQKYWWCWAVSAYSHEKD